MSGPVRVMAGFMRRASLVAAVAAAVFGVFVGAEHLSTESTGSPNVLGVKLEAAPAGNNGCGNGNGGSSGAKSCSNPAKAFAVNGTSTEPVMVLGASTPFTVYVTNPNAQDMQITSIKSTVGKPSGGPLDPKKPACDANWVAPPGYDYHSGDSKLVVPANSFLPVTLSISLQDLPINQDNCKGATFPVALTATADQVH